MKVRVTSKLSASLLNLVRQGHVDIVPLLRQRVRDERRLAAWLDGQKTYASGAPCQKCGGYVRRVRDAACATCQRNRTGFVTHEQGKTAVDGRRLHSRGDANWNGMKRPTHSLQGTIARQEERRGERMGQHVEYRAGAWIGRRYPTGRLDLHDTHLGWRQSDLKTAADRDRNAIMGYLAGWPDAVAILTAAGWSTGCDMNEAMQRVRVVEHAGG